MFRQVYTMYITSDLRHSIFTAECERNRDDLLISGGAVPNLLLYPRCQLHPGSKEHCKQDDRMGFKRRNKVSQGDMIHKAGHLQF